MSASRISHRLERRRGREGRCKEREEVGAVRER